MIALGPSLMNAVAGLAMLFDNLVYLVMQGTLLPVSL